MKQVLVALLATHAVACTHYASDSGWDTPSGEAPPPVLTPVVFPSGEAFNYDQIFSFRLGDCETGLTY